MWVTPLLLYEVYSAFLAFCFLDVIICKPQNVHILCGISTGKRWKDQGHSPTSGVVVQLLGVVWRSATGQKSVTPVEWPQLDELSAKHRTHYNWCSSRLTNEALKGMLSSWGVRLIIHTSSTNLWAHARDQTWTGHKATSWRWWLCCPLETTYWWCCPLWTGHGVHLWWCRVRATDTGRWGDLWGWGHAWDGLCTACGWKTGVRIRYHRWIWARCWHGGLWWSAFSGLCNRCWKFQQSQSKHGTLRVVMTKQKIIKINFRLQIFLGKKDRTVLCLKTWFMQCHRWRVLLGLCSQPSF